MYDVVVSGGGPTGLLLAYALKQHGVEKVAVVERRGPPECQEKTKGKALAFHARSLEVLADLGIVDRFMERGLRWTHIHVQEQDGTTVAKVELAGIIHSPFNCVLSLPQYHTEDLLQEACAEAGVEMLYNITVESVSLGIDHATLSCVDSAGKPATIEGSWVVASDGAHSSIRHSLGIPYEGEDIKMCVAMASCKMEREGMPAEVLSVCMSDEGLTLLFFERDQRVRLLFAYDDYEKAMASVSEHPPLSYFEEELQRRIPDLKFKLSDGTWMTRFTIRQRMVQEQRRGRVIFAGDASHSHSPVGGLGMNTGLQDSYNLAWKLALVAKGIGRSSLIDSYQEERLPVATELLRTTGASSRFVSNVGNPIFKGVRKVVAATNAVAHATRFLGGMVGMTNVNYKGASLSVDSVSNVSFLQSIPLVGAASAVSAGVRIPDAPLVNSGDGSPTTVHQLCQGTAFCLFLFPGTAEDGLDDTFAILKSLASYGIGQAHVKPVIVAADAAVAAPFLERGAAPVVIDTEGHMCHAALGIADVPTAVLVRPDLHVGLVQQPASNEGVLGYLMTKVFY